MTMTLSGTAGVTFPAGGLGNTAGAVVGTSDTQTLSNKTISGSLNMTGGTKYQVGGVTTNALAWVNFAGASGTIAASYNVSSVTRTGTGSFTINFSTSLTDNKYTVSGSCGSGANTGGVAVCNYQGLPTTSACYVSTFTLTPSLNDYAYTSVQIFGN